MIKKLSLTLAAMAVTFLVVLGCVRFGALLLGVGPVDGSGAFPSFLLASVAGAVMGALMYSELDKR